MLEFCRTGVLIIPAAVSPQVCTRCIEYLEGRSPSEPIRIPQGMTFDDLERIRTVLTLPSCISMEYRDRAVGFVACIFMCVTDYMLPQTNAPSSILLERWFLEGVLLQPQIAGAVRSLLGTHVGLPVHVAHHGGVQPVGPAQGWVCYTRMIVDCLSRHRSVFLSSLPPSISLSPFLTPPLHLQSLLSFVCGYGLY